MRYFGSILFFLNIHLLSTIHIHGLIQKARLTNNHPLCVRNLRGSENEQNIYVNTATKQSVYKKK